MKARVDADACIGCGLCESACPEVFKMDGDKAVVIGSSVASAVEDSCKKAADDCPVAAIVIS